MNEIKFRPAQEEDMPYIHEKLKNYLLDDTNISREQFLVARLKERTVAFGRIIENPDFFEIASVGVDYYQRKKGIGPKLLTFLAEEAKRRDSKKPIYGVTSIPGFVVKAGFKEVSDYPAVLEHKRTTMFIDSSKARVVKYTPF